MYRNYISAKSVDEAMAVLQNGGARIIAGGTDLMIALEEGEKDYNTIVDVTTIPQLREIHRAGDTLIIGPCATFQEIETNAQIRQLIPALSQAASQVGSPQTRNVATLGGNIVNAMPAADGATALFALSAHVQVAGPNGVRSMPIESCYKGIGKSAIDPEKEIVTGIIIPLNEVGKSVYKRFALRKSLALPVVAAAAALKVENHIIVQARLVLSPAGIMPWVAKEAEAHLQGAKIDKSLLLSVAADAAAAAPFRDSPVRCSAAYKHELAHALLGEAMMELYDAWWMEA